MSQLLENCALNTCNSGTLFSSPGSCFIRTDQLDGETDWKLKVAVSCTQRLPALGVSALALLAAGQHARGCVPASLLNTLTVFQNNFMITNKGLLKIMPKSFCGGLAPAHSGRGFALLLARHLLFSPFPFTFGFYFYFLF